MVRFFFLVFLAVSFAAGVIAADQLGDPEVGERHFTKCMACHQIGVGAEDKIGPHLNGLFGRSAAAHDGYRYSKSMTGAGVEGLVWTADTLDAFIENPRSVVPKTRMSYRGMKNAEDRADLIAFLRVHSNSPADIPKVELAADATDYDLDPAILAIVGDPDYGEYLSAECLTCHKADGTAEGIPSITQWDEEDFVFAMHAYKNKERPHPVMQMLAGRLSNDEIAALAAYFKTLE